MKPAKDLTPSGILTAMNADDLRGKIRNLLCDWHGLLDRAFEENISPIERRRMELVAAEEIIAAMPCEQIATGNSEEVVTWKGKLVADMTREELVSALSECAKLYGEAIKP